MQRKETRRASNEKGEKKLLHKKTTQAWERLLLSLAHTTVMAMNFYSVEIITDTEQTR